MLEVDRSLRHNEAPTEINATMDNALPASAAERHGFEYYRHGTLSASVSTPEQIKKTTLMHALADNLGARGADGLKRKWDIGTRYSFADTYQNLMDRKSLKPRVYPATDDGTRDGNPVLLTPAAWEITKRDQPTNVLASQMLQNPAANKVRARA